MNLLRDRNYCTITDIALWIGKSRIIAKNVTFDNDFPRSILHGKRFYWLTKEVKKFLKQKSLLAPKKSEN